MKSLRYSLGSPVFWRVVVLAIVSGSAIGIASAQDKKSPRSKSTAKAKTSAKSPAKTPGAATKYDRHLTANMKLLNVLSRYADALAGATDAATAALAATRIESITKEAILAGEELVKLGRPEPTLESKLAKDPDLEMTSRNVAEQTRSAVKSVAANADVKAILTPAIENFQAALNRVQQAAEDPHGPAAPDKSQPSAPAPETTGTLPAEPAPPAARASEAASVPVPPR